MRRLILRRYGLTFLLCCVLAACATTPPPPFSPIRGERFGSTPLSVQRMLVVVDFPIEYKAVIAEPLARDLLQQLKMLGVEVESETKSISPLTRKSPDFSYRQHKPHAILLAHMGDSAYGGGFDRWTISFDLLDVQGRGIWRGTTSLSRFSNIEATTSLLTQDLLKILSDESILTFPKRKNS